MNHSACSTLLVASAQALVASSLLACAPSTRLPMARSMQASDSGAVIVAVPETTLVHVVGPTAVEDCRRALSLGWYSCSTVADRCTQLILTAKGDTILSFDPADCDADLAQGRWMLGSPLTPKISLIPIRGPDEPAPEIPPRP